MEDDKTKREEVFIYAKNRFKAKNDSQAKKHPMITSIRKKADEKYLTLLSKHHSLSGLQSHSVFHFQGVSMHHKLLYQADKCYHLIRDYLLARKLRMDRFAIMSNIRLEEYLDKLKQSPPAELIAKNQSAFIKHLTTGLKTLAMIKPDEIVPSQPTVYPIKPMIYSTLASNTYNAAMKAMGLSKINSKDKALLFSLTALSFSFIYTRYKAYQLKDERHSQHEAAFNDLVVNNHKYKKLFDVLSTKEDREYLKCCQEEMRSPKRDTSNSSQTIIKLLVPCGLFAYSLFNPLFRPYLLKKMAIGFLLTNELLSYSSLISRVLSNRILLNPKERFFKENIVNAYELK